MMTVVMIGRYIECCYAECHYAECCYAECHYAECHAADESAFQQGEPIFNKYFQL